jgi:hypothetical protein
MTPDPEIRTLRDVVHSIRRRKLPLPRSQVDLFRLLQHYDPAQGLDALLDMVDFTGARPIDIYWTVLARAPHEIAEAAPGELFDPRALFAALLSSEEFRGRTISAVLAAFPEKHRDIFIHVPKCAGTDLNMNLAQRFLPLPKLWEHSNWIAQDDFLASLAGLARALPFHDRVFVYGHMELAEYLERVGLRPADKVFTIIRDPLELMLSQANYAITRLRQDPTGSDPDSRAVLAQLNLSVLPPETSESELKELAIRALLDPRIARANRACHYLGQRGHPVYEAAISNLVIHDVEITTTQHYGRWLDERWGIERSRRHNTSQPILTLAEVRRSYAAALAPLMAEDQKLFDVVSWALQQAGSASVSGLEIARLAGPGLLDELPQKLRGERETARVSGGGNPETDLLVVQGARQVSRYLQPGAVAVPGVPINEETTSITFGADGNGREHLMDGWARPEKAFTWSNGTKASLRLPGLPHGGRSIIRLVGTPYTVKDRLPLQRIDVLVNDLPLGVARIRDAAVIECEIPPELMEEKAPLVLTLRLPSAMQPHALDPAKGDKRLLAFALRQLTVLHLRDSQEAAGDAARTEAAA